MGILDTVKLPQGAKRVSILDSVKVPVNRGAAFEMQSLQQRQNVEIDKASEFRPLKSFTEGWKSHQGADRSFKSAVVEGNMVQEGAKVYADTLADFNTRNKNTKETFTNYFDGKAGKADLAASIGSSLLGIVNVGFAPIAGALKGAETIPVLGLVATGVNKFAAGLAGTGANSAGSLLEAIPEGVLDQETTDKLKPLTEEIGGLVGMLVGFKYAGKATGKVSSGITESSYVKPRIEALELKLQQMGEIIRNDPKLGTEVARFVAEHGPARNVPVTSKTPGATDVPVMSPNKKHAAYSKEMGYEPYTPDAKLPVIDAGTGGGGGGAPNSVEIQPTLMGEAKPYTTPKKPTSELLEESRVAPKEEVATKTDEAKAEPEFLSDDYNMMLIEMEQARPGRRGANAYTDESGAIVKLTSDRSTFPEWIPDDLRKSTYVQKYQKSRTGMTSDLSITYKEGSPMDRMHKAFIEELQRREETVNARKETQRLEEEGRAAESIEDTSMAEAEYAKLPTDTPNTGTAGKPELMQPVAGTGELRNPTLTQRAVEDLSGQVKEAYKESPLPMHQRANFNEVATKVLDAFNADPKYAMDVAMGREILPPGSDMIQTAFWVEAVNRAKASGDVQGMIDLAHSRVAEFATRAGQEISYLRMLKEGDPVNIIKKLNDSFKEAFEKRTQQSAAETVDVQVATMKRFIKESTLPVEKWLEVIKDIKTC